MEIKFGSEAWEQYLGWQAQDKKTLKRINELLKDIVRGNPFVGIGKPEPLKGDFSGCWSRRIDEQNRLVYRIQREHDDVCHVIQCKGHYA
ncbi:Txe/YoeB family addiction module toxin [Desulfosarcina sp. OttesenSCG-928-G10]|nr:Txe/YoeB family addiction module toxin [Desulfosarcina sp. OttesenSCG-928-G10]